MKGLTKNTIFVILFLLASNTFAQFTLSAELRPRTEYRHGFSSLIADTEKAAFFTSQRTRLNFNYKSEDVSVFVSFQDVRVWGDVVQLNRSDANSSIHEAWAELKLAKGFNVRLGRQELVYDNARIFGNVDWAQQGRSHDLALFKFSLNEKSQLHAGFAFNQAGENRVSTDYLLNNYKAMQFAWFNTKFDKGGLSLLFLNNGIQKDSKTVYSQTSGGRVTFNPGSLRLAGSAYLQTGRDAADRKLSAYYAAAEAGYVLSPKVTASLGFELLSGTDMADWQGQNVVNRSFAPLYGTNHAFNGHMDYFYVGNHANNVGLLNPYASVTYRNKALTLQAMGHLFFADGKITELGNPTNQMESYFGTELDLIVGYTLGQRATIRGGYSQMFGTCSLQRLKSGNHQKTQNWAWLMVVVKPTLFGN